MKYIIALDLDETLLKDDKTLSERNKLAIAKCKEMGAIITISSTRGYGSCEEIAKEISADYVCCHSGNMIVDVSNENIVYKKGFNKSELTSMINTFSHFTKNIIVDSVKNLYGGIGDETAKYWGVLPLPLDKIPNKEIFKMCVWYDNSFRKNIEQYCNTHNFICRPMRGAPFMLITPQDSDKFYALEHLAKLLNIKLENVIVFGDDDSDSLSIQKVGIGVAMANSNERVLKIAKNITSTNNNDGVAEFLENMFSI